MISIDLTNLGSFLTTVVNNVTNLLGGSTVSGLVKSVETVALLAVTGVLGLLSSIPG
jgi:hypothetical protein